MLFSVFTTVGMYGQAVLTGIVQDDRSREPIPFVNLLLEGTALGGTTDMDGMFRIEGIEPGLYNVLVSCVGYEAKTVFEVQVGTAKVPFIEIVLVATSTELDVVEVRQKRIDRTTESPLSLRSISEAEILRNPGGNRDISKVIQALPGVASTVSFRNDIIIRGGSPNENTFYLDGIEIPVINHFATQGASGGPVGMINVNFIEGVDVLSGAFPAARGNALSSVFEFKQKEGNREKLNYTFMLGSSDIGFTVDGPTGENSSLILSARRSYLQFLFSVLGLPFLPTYNDVQFKQTFRMKNDDKLVILGIGAFDDLNLNLKVNDGVEDEEQLRSNTYLINNLPEQTQWNYTVGARYDHFREKSLHRFVLSRSHLNNSAIKYFENDDSDVNNRILDYASTESGTKFRYEGKWYMGNWTLAAGAAVERSEYTTDTDARRTIQGQSVELRYETDLNFMEYGQFVQLSREFGDFSLSLGVRNDQADVASSMSGALDQISPRLSMSYGISDAVAINFNTGRYCQLPPFTTLGFRNDEGVLENLENGLQYVRADHLVAGIEYTTNSSAKLSIEGFYKRYDNYPLLTDNGVSLANLGGDFGVVGNEPAISDSEGRAYGFEVLVQQKLWKDFYGILAYTFVTSEFTNGDGDFAPSSWDFGNIVNLTAGKRLKKNWEVGMKFRLQGGGPYSPFDVATSSLIPVWNDNQMGLPDYTRVNTLRTDLFHAADIRIDKRKYYENWTLNVYLDIQNLYAADVPSPPFLDVVRDDQGQPVVDPNDASRYLTELVPDQNGNVLPSIGIMIEF